MLVLTRKKGERIHIGDDITVVITKIDGGRVGVGIEAPAQVRIERKEIAEKKRQPVACSAAMEPELTTV